MDSLYLLIPIALIFVVIAIKLFIWAVKSGQYEDLNTEASRILFDESPAMPPASEAKLTGEDAIEVKDISSADERPVDASKPVSNTKLDSGLNNGDQS